VSSVYVPTSSMPAVFRAIANANPISVIVNALRSLWIDAPAHDDVLFGVLWCLGITAVFLSAGDVALPARHRPVALSGRSGSRPRPFSSSSRWRT